MTRAKFVYSPSEASSMAAEEPNQRSLLWLLPSLVSAATSLARPPISNYPVAAVGLGSSGRIFVGVNLEFPGLPLHHSVHAEQFLVTNLALNGEQILRYIAVSSAPCGHCRQFLQEIRQATEIGIFIADEENSSCVKFPKTADFDEKFRKLSNFLPQRFGPDDLLSKNVPLLLEPHENGLYLKSCGERSLCNGDSRSSEDSVVRLKQLALEAANASYAPYSSCPSGVALMDSEGKVYRGWYTESAAYNPSLGPVQAALVDYVANGGGEGYERIVAAVLVEKEGGHVRQEDTARLILKVISPDCLFRVFHCSSAHY